MHDGRTFNQEQNLCANLMYQWVLLIQGIALDVTAGAKNKTKIEYGIKCPSYIVSKVKHD